MRFIIHGKIAITILLLGFFLFGKLQLGLVRYFDVDELAYLHWAHNVFVGQLPYIDFFSYVPPGFLWFLSPLFFVFQGVDILTASRALAFLIFVGMCGALGVLLVLMRGKSVWYFLLPGLILSFLPLPADKFLEIRPDNLAVLISLIGLICQIRHMSFLAGLFYSASLLVLPKTVPLVAVAILFALFGKKKRFFFFGLILPIFLFGVWVLSIGDFSTVWYSLTRLPLEINKLGNVFAMRPDLFFYPNDVFYGSQGWSTGLIANHAIWIIGLLWGVYRLLSATSRTVALLGCMMIVHVVTFMYGYPMRNAQYLIPIAVFVAFYTGDFLIALDKRIGAFAVFGLMSILVPISMEVNRSKLLWTNGENKAVVSWAVANIPKDSYVLDFEGATIFYRDPYYVCCLPFGQYTPFLTRPFPSLTSALTKTKTEYIYEGRSGRIEMLSQSEQTYIRSRYKKIVHNYAKAH